MTPEQIFKVLYEFLQSEDAQESLSHLDTESNFGDWWWDTGYYDGAEIEDVMYCLGRLECFSDIIRYCRTNITPTMPEWTAWQAFEEGYL